MDLNFSHDELVFREDVRAFLIDHLPDDIRARMRRGDDSRIDHDVSAWQRILHAQGWGAPAWPFAFGGMGMTDELDVSHCFKRLLAFELRFGSTDQHLAACREGLVA